MKYNSVLCFLIMAVVFTISAASMSDVYSLYLESIADNPLTETRYEFVFEASDQSVFDAMCESFPEQIPRYKELQIRSRIGDSSSAAQNKFTNLIAFVPDICDDREEVLYYGKTIRDLENGEFYYSAVAATQFMIDEQSDTVMFRNQQYGLCGVGAIIDDTASDDDFYEQLSKIYCTQGMFFEITNKFSGVIFQFREPLSAREETELRDYMDSLFEVTDYIRPYNIDKTAEKQIEKSLVSSVLLLLACIICVAEIMDFYLSIFDTERAVFKICGASNIRMVGFDLIRIIEMAITAIVGGYLIALTMNAFNNRFFNGLIFDLIFLMWIVVVFVVLIVSVWAVRMLTRQIKKGAILT